MKKPYKNYEQLETFIVIFGPAIFACAYYCTVCELTLEGKRLYAAASSSVTFEIIFSRRLIFREDLFIHSRLDLPSKVGDHYVDYDDHFLPLYRSIAYCDQICTQ